MRGDICFFCSPENPEEQATTENVPETAPSSQSAVTPPPAPESPETPPPQADSSPIPSPTKAAPSPQPVGQKKDGAPPKVLSHRRKGWRLSRFISEWYTVILEVSFVLILVIPLEIWILSLIWSTFFNAFLKLLFSIVAVPVVLLFCISIVGPLFILVDNRARLQSIEALLSKAEE